MKQRKSRTVGRRRVLELGARGTLALGLGGAGFPAILSGCVQEKPPLNIADIGETPLWQRAAKKGLIFGTAMGRKSIRDHRLRRIIAEDCKMVCPETQLFWRRMEHDRGDVSFRRPDKVARFVKKNGMMFQGNSLFWYYSHPRWLKEFVADKNNDARKLLVDHVGQTVGHYAGQAHSWVVANEVVDAKGSRSDGLRETPFLEAIGPDYIALAYHAAAEADPDALLIYNDYGLHADWPQIPRKRMVTLALLEKLLKQGVPIQAMGIQGHLAPGPEGAFDPASLRDFCTEIAGLGLKIVITEMDSRDTHVNGSIALRDRMTADALRAYLDVVLDQPATIAVVNWEMSDRYSWVDKFFPRDDGDRVRGCLYDVDMNKKQAWYAVASAIDNCRPRPKTAT